MRPPITDPLLTLPGQAIYDAVRRYRFLTGDQVTRLLYARGSRTYAMKHLAILRNARKIYDRNELPREPGSKNPGSTPTLWSRDDVILSDRAFLKHLTLVNDTLIALERFCREHQDAELLSLMHDYDLRENPPVVPHEGKPTKVINDGFASIDWEGRVFAFALEADLGTESLDDPHQSTTWRDKVERLVLLGKGPYREHFAVDTMQVAVVVRSGKTSARTRIKNLIVWTESVLKEIAPQWGSFFLFTDADPAQMSPEEFVLGRHWVQPFDHHQFHALLPS